MLVFLVVCGTSQAEPLAEHPDEYDPYVRSLTPAEGIFDCLIHTVCCLESFFGAACVIISGVILSLP